MHQVLVAACRSLVFTASRRSFRCSLWSLSCGLWDLVPWPEMQLRPLALGAWSLSQLDHQGSPFPFFFFKSLVRYLFSHTWPVLEPSPTCVHNFLLIWIPPQKPVGGLPTLTMGWRPLPFWPLRSLTAHVQTGKSSLISGEVILSPYFSTAQLLSLECLGKAKLQFYSSWKTPAVQPRGPSISYLSAIHWKKSRLMGEHMLVK